MKLRNSLFLWAVLSTAPLSAGFSCSGQVRPFGALGIGVRSLGCSPRRERFPHRLSMSLTPEQLEVARKPVECLSPDNARATALGRRGFSWLVGAVILSGAAGQSRAESFLDQNRAIEVLGNAMRGSIGALDVALGKTKARPIRMQDRPALAKTFASALAGAIQRVAVDDEKLFTKNELEKLEQAYALKCVSFFPGAAEALKATGWSSEQTQIKFDDMWDYEALANLALYARLHIISGRTPSPLSRRNFNQLVASRVLNDAFDQTSFQVDRYTVNDPQSDMRWMEGVVAMLTAYNEAGYGVGTVGEKSYGRLDEIGWKEDGMGQFSVFFSNLALIDAAQCLAGEAQNDLAAAILPTQALLAYLKTCGIDADAEDYYMGNTFQSNPANYRPDGLVIQFNIQSRKRGPAA